MKVAIIGAGASGLFLTFLLKSMGVTVYLLEKNNQIGKKLAITGQGRCNITNNCTKDEFLENVVRGKRFMQSSISHFRCADTIRFFRGMDLELKVERGRRVFPESDKASDVVDFFEKFTEGSLIKNCKVESIEYSFDKLSVFAEKKDGRTLESTFDAVVIATGGKSYPKTGSTGDGYKFAKSLGHTIVPIKPALCPIKLVDTYNLEGLSLKNVTLHAIADGKKFEQFGEMVFTADGISGPIVLSMSSFINRAKKVELELDLKPALDEQQLDARLLREFNEGKNKQLKSVMAELLPQSLILPFISACNIIAYKQANAVTKSERMQIIEKLKHFPLEFDELSPVEDGIITSGGVKLSEINPKTMESKIVPNLYFIGEVLDVDALTGGFNLQVCWSTAMACANALAEKIEDKYSDINIDEFIRIIAENISNMDE